MRVFQFHSCYPAYFDYLAKRHAEPAEMSFQERLTLLLEHRYNAVHILEPVYRGDPEVAVTVANDPLLQERWAAEHGLVSRDPSDILLAQIEEHRAEVVYNLDPCRWDSSFVRRLPGCVKKNVCWRAAPLGRSDYRAFDLRVCNFPPYIQAWEAAGMRAAYFSPSHDPRMMEFASREQRPIDIAFVGSYSHFHTRRNSLLKAVAALADRWRVVFALVHPDRKPLVNLPLLRRIPGPFKYLPRSVEKASVPPVFGLELYELFGSAKIVVNAAIDMSDQFRGNMRCFEAMGCGACMLSDAGIYPERMDSGVHFLAFDNEADALQKARTLLDAPKRAREIGHAASENLRTHYSKSAQWNEFQKLVAAL